MKYTGGCHCGAVRYSVEMDLERVMECNCSICSKKAILMAFAPEANMTLEQGADMLVDYQFGKHTIHHMFCKVCGIHSFGKATGPDGTKMIAANARCLDGVDFKALPVDQFDGKSL